VLRFDSVVRVATMATKNITWKMPPIVSRLLITLRNTKLRSTGRMISAIRKRVACQAFGSYVGLLKMIRPDKVLDETDKAAAQLQIQAMTVIHPNACVSSNMLYKAG
jgi:hypothetical protein